MKFRCGNTFTLEPRSNWILVRNYDHSISDRGRCWFNRALMTVHEAQYLILYGNASTVLVLLFVASNGTHNSRVTGRARTHDDVVVLTAPNKRSRVTMSFGQHPHDATRQFSAPHSLPVAAGLADLRPRATYGDHRQFSLRPVAWDVNPATVMAFVLKFTALYAARLDLEGSPHPEYSRDTRYPRSGAARALLGMTGALCKHSFDLPPSRLLLQLIAHASVNHPTTLSFTSTCSRWQGSDRATGSAAVEQRDWHHGLRQSRGKRAGAGWRPALAGLQHNRPAPPPLCPSRTGAARQLPWTSKWRDQRTTASRPPSPPPLSGGLTQTVVNTRHGPIEARRCSQDREQQRKYTYISKHLFTNLLSNLKSKTTPFSLDALAEKQFDVGTLRLVVRSQRDRSSSSSVYGTIRRCLRFPHRSRIQVQLTSILSAPGKTRLRRYFPRLKLTEWECEALDSGIINAHRKIKSKTNLKHSQKSKGKSQNKRTKQEEKKYSREAKPRRQGHWKCDEPGYLCLRHSTTALQIEIREEHYRLFTEQWHFSKVHFKSAHFMVNSLYTIPHSTSSRPRREDDRVTVRETLGPPTGTGFGSRRDRFWILAYENHALSMFPFPGPRSLRRLAENRVQAVQICLLRNSVRERKRGEREREQERFASSVAHRLAFKKPTKSPTQACVLVSPVSRPRFLTLDAQLHIPLKQDFRKCSFDREQPIRAEVWKPRNAVTGGRGSAGTQPAAALRAGETGVPRENPLASGIVQHNSHMRENPGVEPGSPWWEASALAPAPPLPHQETLFSSQRTNSRKGIATCIFFTTRRKEV
ncbi:hypothetical protein PR048_031801 [Dryococelus australis]|uniref:Uncharacterized protein n=1 Tax=Dryococelus australis TaxID=614101 RepID=A0ABQ9G7A7_9NEOP|nr:hypothetical protein PR048_031801 [Dryococelus australis]